MFTQDDLLQLVQMRMPFGKYEGRILADIPEEYLLWLNRNELPAGKLGQLLALMLEIRINGLEGLLTPLRKRTSHAHPVHLSVQ